LARRVRLVRLALRVIRVPLGLLVRRVPPAPLGLLHRPRRVIRRSVTSVKPLARNGPSTPLKGAACLLVLSAFYR